MTKAQEEIVKEKLNDQVDYYENIRDLAYVSGHQNPDTDSICSAISYANFKNLQGHIKAKPIRLGSVSRETQFVLDYFGVEAPELKKTLKPQVQDLNIDRPHKAKATDPIADLLDIIEKSDTMNAQIVDDEGKLDGIITLSDLTNIYMDVSDDKILSNASTPVENIVKVLDASVAYMPGSPRIHSGNMRVYATKAGSAEETINKNDIVLVGDRLEAQLDAIRKEIAILIITIGAEVDDRVLEAAKRKDVTVITTKLDTFKAARLLPLAIPISYNMTSDDLVVIRTTDYVDEVRAVLQNSRYRAYPVVDEEGILTGTISRYHIIQSEKRPLILVDHNERNQSILDREYGDIIEVIDHHRVDNISTDGPVYFRAEPVGCTSTIVAKMYMEEEIEISRQMAGLMASAIISDTLLLKSPTSTKEDEKILHKLAKIAQIDDIEAYANEMFKAGTSLAGKSANELISEDAKDFIIDGINVRIAQVMTMDLDSLDRIKDDLEEAMEDTMSTTNQDAFVLVFTDILKEVSKIMVLGEYSQAIAKGFGQSLEDNSFLAPGVLSRKKQVVPVVNQVLSE